MIDKSPPLPRTTQVTSRRLISVVLSADQRANFPQTGIDKKGRHGARRVEKDRGAWRNW